MSNTIYKDKEYTPAMVAELREWVNDCQWQDEPDTDQLTDLQILMGCDRNLAGGITEFDFSHL